MRIIPAIDLIEGKCVRLTKGDFSTLTVYYRDPLDAARSFEDNGIRYLHLVDLDGAREKKVVSYRVIERISTKTGLKIDYAGGLRTANDLKVVFECGASQVTGGSIAVSDREVFLNWLSVWGPEKIILGADSRNRKIEISGWQESTSKDVVEFIKEYREDGILYTVCTDIGRDGMMEGPATDLYREIISEAGINVIASGGISSVRDLEVLAEAGCEGAIIGKAIYEGKINLKDLQALC